MVCVISSELAKYNDLSVGDSIKVSNPNNSKETYKLKIVGIYKDSQSSAQAGQAGPNASDPANNIYTSYETLNQIVTASGKKNSESTSAISGRLNGTYVVGTLGKYKQFKKEVKQLGLSTKYQVTSADISSYEQSARPLKNLAKFAGCFLIAIGMKKKQVAALFLTEILILSLAGAIIGGAAGAAVSKPVTKQLLNAPGTSSAADTLTASASVNGAVLLELLGCCVLLALAAGAVSVTAIMRYEPLEILSERDLRHGMKQEGGMWKIS